MLTLTALTDDAGVLAMAAATRAAATAQGGDGECVGLATRLLGQDARRRLGGRAAETSVTITTDVRGTEFVTTLLDQGEPVTNAPDSVLTLLEAGLATAAQARTDGHGNLTEVRFALPSHNRMLDLAAIEVMPDDMPLSTEEVVVRPFEPGDAAALTRLIYRCYGWSYPVATLYYPDRVAAALDSGERIGEVAMTADGEMAAHWGAVFLSPSTVETGGTVTDPRFRKRGLAAQLGERLLTRLLDLGVIGRLREPVLTHPATQQIALREGAAIVGAYIHLAQPIEQIGITDGFTRDRSSLSVAYSALQPLVPATLWIPKSYEQITLSILAAAQWPRELGPVRKDPDTPESSILSTSLDSDNRRGNILVGTVGRDLIDQVHDAMRHMHRAAVEHIAVTLPANQPALATAGAGLQELGLGFAALIPAFREPSAEVPSGDVLITQWVADHEVDTSSWVFADDSVRELVLAIAQQVSDAGTRGHVRQRRAAQRAELFAALDH